MSEQGPRATSTDGIARATGIAWDDWLARLDAQGAAQKPHAEIAALAHARLEAEAGNTSSATNPGWWAQGVTVAYEQHIGRRVPGQTADGRYSAAVSRTIPGTMDDALAGLVARFDGRAELDGVPLESAPTTSATEKWRYFRIALADGSRVDTTINDQAGGKARIGVQHAKISDPDDIARWKAVWRAELAAL
jgi:hypothetical protein